jgi:poly(3-hydroxybutyrate) depolymerase
MDGVWMSYRICIPSGYAGQAVPLIVMFRGCTQNPDDFATGTSMNGLTEESTFLGAYPAQSGSTRCRSRDRFAQRGLKLSAIRFDPNADSAGQHFIRSAFLRLKC